jgi:hypothetical protein
VIASHATLPRSELELLPAAGFEPYGTAASFGWDAVAAFAGGAAVVLANGEARNGQRQYDDEQLPLHGCC